MASDKAFSTSSHHRKTKASSFKDKDERIHECRRRDEHHLRLRLYQEEINHERCIVLDKVIKLKSALSEVLSALLRSNSSPKFLLQQKRQFLEGLLEVNERFAILLGRLYFHKYPSARRDGLMNRADNFRERIKNEEFHFKVWIERQKTHSCPAIHQNIESCVVCVSVWPTRQWLHTSQKTALSA